MMQEFHWTLVSWMVRIFAPMLMATCARACQWMKSLSVLIVFMFLARILSVVGPGGSMRGSPHGSFFVGTVSVFW